MMQPQEIEVWYVLPALRKELCLDLVEAGVSRTKIAGLLGITEPAVSQYVTGKRASKFEFSPKFKAQVKGVSLQLVEEKVNATAALQGFPQRTRPHRGCRARVQHVRPHL